MAIQWANIEAALIAWLSTATGIASNRIVWTHQKSPGLASGSFLSLAISGPQPVGGIDELRWPTDLGQPAGQEVQTTVVGQREISVSVNAYSIQEIGAGTAKELLSLAAVALSKPSQRDAFTAVGAVFLDTSNVDSLPVLGEPGQGRAHMDVRFRVVASVVDPEGYIGTVQFTPPGTVTSG